MAPGLLPSVLGWLRQDSTIAGIAGIAGVLTAVSQGQLDWGQATPLLVAGVVAMALPGGGGGTRIGQMVGGVIQADQAVVRQGPAVVETPAAAGVAPGLPPAAARLAAGEAARDAALAGVMTELTKVVAALATKPAAPPSTAGVSKIEAAFEKALPTAESVAAEVVRLQEEKAVAVPKARIVRPKRVASKLTVGDPPGTEGFDEHQVVARTIYAEARGEGLAGMEAVSACIMNRANNPRWWGNSPRSVCLKNRQFSCWLPSDPQFERIRTVTDADPLFRAAWDVARRALAGEVEDQTGGADHYVNLAVAKPSWARHQEPSAVIGNHTFFRLELDPPGDAWPKEIA